MATVPTTPLDSSGSPGSGSNSGGGARKHRGSPFTSWLKKGNSSLEANSKKLASPAEEIKLVFLRQLELSSFDFNGKHYHSVFTGAQIVDIILNHFGLPDRKLATNVASRLIDCSLYTHVSGPSQGAATAGLVIDSNAEMYTLTSDALAALKALHKGDTLQRAKTHTRKRYMELRGHLYTRSVDSQGTSSDGSSQHGSVAGRASCEPACSSSSSPLSQALRPPPLDLSAAHLKSTAAAARAAAHLSDVSNSPSDTLVALGPGAAAAAAEEDAAAGLALREVSIPTGDFAGLLNTWSFLGGSGASASASAARHSQLLGPGGSTARSGTAYLQAGAMESDDSDSGAAVRRRQRRRAGRGAVRVSRDLESAELARQRRWAVCPEAGEGGGLGGGGALRRCPSAPSLSEQASDSDASYRTASVRDSSAQQQQRASRDSWFGGSQLSDITAASSYGGGAACPLAPASRLSLGRLSVASGSPQPWHTPPPIAAPPAQAAAAALPANAAIDSYDSSGRPSASADSSPVGAMTLLQLQLWRDTVPAQLLQALGPEAVAQQEAIHELVGTERAYLHDLELIDTVFAARLLAQPEVMERTRALGFLHAVFFNYRALIDNSRRLCAQLAARQQASGAVVAGVGDILDAWADDLAAFVEYSVHVPAAQSELEAELLASP
ncbi:Rho guanine nucleotide exchange factor, partial [Coemansia sp. RSA 2424]